MNKQTESLKVREGGSVTADKDGKEISRTKPTKYVASKPAKAKGAGNVK